MTSKTGLNFNADVPITDGNGKLSGSWALVFTLWRNVLSAAKESGTTAERPTTGLWIGRRYYDTTLNQPVYVSAVNPAVWRDAAGTDVT